MRKHELLIKDLPRSRVSSASLVIILSTICCRKLRAVQNFKSFKEARIVLLRRRNFGSGFRGENIENSIDFLRVFCVAWLLPSFPPCFPLSRAAKALLFFIFIGSKTIAFFPFESTTMASSFVAMGDEPNGAYRCTAHSRAQRN